MGLVKAALLVELSGRSLPHRISDVAKNCFELAFEHLVQTVEAAHLLELTGIESVTIDDRFLFKLFTDTFEPFALRLCPWSARHDLLHRGSDAVGVVDERLITGDVAI